jgi:hypothetical protein
MSSAVRSVSSVFVQRLQQARNNLLEVHEGGHSLQDRVLGEVIRHGWDSAF